MRKTFAMIDLDCANCAAKMERAISEIAGVSFASVSYMTQKLTIEAPDEVFESVLREAQKRVKKIEPDCRIKL